MLVRTLDGNFTRFSVVISVTNTPKFVKNSFWKMKFNVVRTQTGISKLFGKDWVWVQRLVYLQLSYSICVIRFSTAFLKNGRFSQPIDSFQVTLCTALTYHQWENSIWNTQGSYPAAFLSHLSSCYIMIDTLWLTVTNLSPHWSCSCATMCHLSP